MGFRDRKKMKSCKIYIQPFSKKMGKCKKKECTLKHAIYNYRVQNKGAFCFNHKHDGMIDVVNPTCEHEGCDTQPSYNDRGQKKRRFCVHHKHDGMIDVVSPTCEHEGCDTQPVYNDRGQKKGRFCMLHKHDGMINVVNPTCEHEGCDIIVNSYRIKYDGYCTHCFSNLFPHDPRTAKIRTKSKEIQWVNAILQQFPAPDWIWDKPLYVDFSGGCCVSKRRIDLRALLEHPDQGLFWLCIEIDENQHRGYEDGYEIVRYNDLFLDFSGRYVFLRINPDPFQEGLDRKDPPFEERLAIVDKEIQDIMENGGSEELIDVRHLFYDDGV
jgi:hypothetical protein